jgi:hypothetical protein
MRTSKCVAALVLIAATGAGLSVKAGQDNTPQPTAPSNTRSASCIVRTTADPEVIPLNADTVMALLRSPAVAHRAAREVFGSQLPDSVINTTWLRPDEPAGRRQARPSPGSGGPALPDQDTIRELEEIYGAEYLKQMGLPPAGRERKGENEPNRPSAGAAREPYGGPYGVVVPKGRIGMVPYGAAPGPQIGQPMEQSVTFELAIRLPSDVKPAARELTTAVVNRLGQCLDEAYRGRVKELEDLLNTAESQRIDLERLFGGDRARSEDDQRVNEQLNTLVDLSALNPRMALGEAVEMLRKAVEPPLNIAVLWTDLRERLEIEPTTPVNIDGMPRIRLGTALDLLVQGLPSNDVRVARTIRDGAIVIGTTATLGAPGLPPEGPAADIDIKALMVQRSDLTRKLQGLEVEMASMDARRQAIAREIDRIRHEAEAKLANDPVAAELERLVQSNMEILNRRQRVADNSPAAVTDLAQANENLTRARIELAKRREELARQTGGGQLEAFTAEMVRMTVDNAEKQAQMAILHRQLDQTQAQLAQATRFDPEAARARAMREGLEVMDRRIAELRIRLATLQAPTVTVIGAD